MTWTTAAAVFALNVPFGYWRAGLRRLSVPWFIAIHAPVVLAILLRLWMNIPFRWVTLPLFAGAFFVGQWAGGKLRKTSTQ